MSQEIHELTREYNDKLIGLNGVVFTSLGKNFEKLLDSLPDYYPETISFHVDRKSVDHIKSHFQNIFTQVKEQLKHKINVVTHKELTPFHPFLRETPFQTHKFYFQQGNYPDDYIVSIEDAVVNIFRELKNSGLILNRDFPTHNIASISSYFVTTDECKTYIQSILDLEAEIKDKYSKKKKKDYEENLKKAKQAWISET